MNYPGDTAEPREVGRWMAYVARSEYALPGILAVMCSCVELTDAWTGPGNVKDVPGYLENVDYDSFGYFQQRPSQGWGSWEQVTDANYALRKFCEEAAKLKDHEWHADTTNPDALGRWCQAVQRSAYPVAYREKGYPMAVEILGEENLLEYPESLITVGGNGWWVDSETKAYVRTDARDSSKGVVVNRNGWLYDSEAEAFTSFAPVQPDKKRWEWPEASASPGYLGDGSYIDLHPSRWDRVWRSDIEDFARGLVDTYGVSCNTYVGHPPPELVGGVYYDSVSVDVWGGGRGGGRGSAIDPSLGQAIFDEVFGNGQEPWIRWCIWWGWMYVDGVGWSWYSEDEYYSDAGHFRHIHYTMY